MCVRRVHDAMRICVKIHAWTHARTYSLFFVLVCRNRYARPAYIGHDCDIKCEIGKHSFYHYSPDSLSSVIAARRTLAVPRLFFSTEFPFGDTKKEETGIPTHRASIHASRTNTGGSVPEIVQHWFSRVAIGWYINWYDFSHLRRELLWKEYPNQTYDGNAKRAVSGKCWIFSIFNAYYDFKHLILTFYYIITFSIFCIIKPL